MRVAVMHRAPVLCGAEVLGIPPAGGLADPPEVTQQAIPRAGLLAQVRNRRGVIVAVEVREAAP